MKSNTLSGIGRCLRQLRELISTNTGCRRRHNTMIQCHCVESLENRLPLSATTEENDSAQQSLDYLRSAMDQFHNRFPIYDDVSSAGNHFHAVAKFPNASAPVDIRGDFSENTRSGATAIRAEFLNTSASFGGVYFQNGILASGSTSPEVNFGTVGNAGLDLSGAHALTFWARGETGGEKIEFFLGGVGRDAESGAPIEPFPDSSPRIPAVATVTTLTQNWQKFTIDLSGANLSYVLGGFGWSASLLQNPNGAVFYLDDLQYELNEESREERLNEPRFLRSFTTLPRQTDPLDANRDDDFDVVFRNSAFTYDNALALLAFLVDGTPDSVRRATLIGDAFVYASTHDRTFVDGRLRSAFSAGDIALPPGWIPNNKTGTVPVSGFYVDSQQRFIEVEQDAVDTGNNSWAMISLLALYRKTGNQIYLTTARRIGDFIRTQHVSTDAFSGFRAGIRDPESLSPIQRSHSSSEHNIDNYAAFMTMYAVTGDLVWYHNAERARNFVTSMWSDQKQSFLAGTIDPNTRNENAGQLPLDVQAWSILSIPEIRGMHPDLIAGIDTHFSTSEAGLTGFDFNDDQDGVWPEGTGQMAVAYSGIDASRAGNLRNVLRQIQATAPTDVRGSLRAALHDGLSTGFDTAAGTPFEYFDRPHVGATAWNVFAQLGVNPYYLMPLPLPEPAVITNPPGATPAQRPVIAWTSVPGATEYEIWLTKNPSTSPYYQVVVTGTSYTPPLDFGIGKFNLWVRAKNSSGFGPWTPKHTFVINTAVSMDSLLRSQPTLRPTISWDVLPGAVKYDVWIDDVSRGITQHIRNMNVTGTSFRPSANLPLGVYRVWVRGIAADGTAGAWSGGIEFLPMQAPTITQGQNPTFDRTPTFAWNALPGAAKYEVFIRNRNTGTTTLHEANIASLNFTPSTPIPDGPYRWWAIGVSAQGVRSFWTAPMDIYIGGRTDLLTPLGSSSDSTPTFTWRPVDGAVRYDLFVNLDGGQAQIIRQQNLTTTGFAPITPLPIGNYRAWIRAVSTTGEISPWSLQVNFSFVTATDVDYSNSFPEGLLAQGLVVLASIVIDSSRVPAWDGQTPGSGAFHPQITFSDSSSKRYERLSIAWRPSGIRDQTIDILASKQARLLGDSCRSVTASEFGDDEMAIDTLITEPADQDPARVPFQ